jgi:hypothetical protein
MTAPARTPPLARSLLWIDCSAGLLVGVLVLTLSPWLSTWYQIPRRLLVVMGIANLIYGAFSFSLARQHVRPRRLLVTLIVANATWSLWCLLAAALLMGRASALGLASLVFEGVFVGGLAWLEWRWRESLVSVRA